MKEIGADSRRDKWFSPIKMAIEIGHLVNDYQLYHAGIHEKA